MKKIKLFHTLVIVVIILFSGYSGCTCDNEEKEDPLNIIVLLDLSDRISKEKYSEIAAQQVENDQINCEIIIEVFKRIVVKEEKLNRSKSMLRFLILEQQGFQIDSEHKRKLLAFEENPIRTPANFNRLENDVVKTITKLYDTIPDEPEVKFTGADIWSWFRHEAEQYLHRGYRNYIICLSDGYLDFNEEIQKEREKGTYMVINEELRKSPDWEDKIRKEYKMSPAQNFIDYRVQFLMVGIKDRLPDGSSRDRDIIESYWKFWLESMTIEPFDFYRSEIGESEIEAFLEGVEKN